MPLIMPIKDLRNTTEISNIAHKEQEPIFITKNGYGDLVVMSIETYDELLGTNHIDKAIFEAEQEEAGGLDGRRLLRGEEGEIRPRSRFPRWKKDPNQLLLSGYR